MYDVPVTLDVAVLTAEFACIVFVYDVPETLEVAVLTVVLA